MTPAEQARNQAITLEAKKDALSQRQSGDWKVSFTVQGVDMDARLTSAPMGTRVKIRKKVPREYCSEILSIIPPIVPAAFCPMAMAKYHTPNIKPIIRGGTSLLK